MAARAAFVVFGLNGFVYASWVSRIPAIRAHLDLTATEMGLVLLVGATGALVALPLSGAVVDRVGTKNATRLAAACCAAGLTAAAVAVGTGSTPHVAISSLAAAMGVGAWDVAMNIQGSVVEHAFGRAMLPRFHAGFSLGAVLGAGGGAVAAGVGLSVTAHVIASSVSAAVLAAGAVRWFLPDDGLARRSDGPEPPAAPENAFSAWLEPRTLLIGLVVLAAALAEGSANDWLALAVVVDFGAEDALGALALGVFVTAMTLMRIVGTRLIDRLGRVTVLRVSAVVALAGLVVFALVPWLPLALCGAAAWGLGSAMGFPVGMSAASDDPHRAAARVAVVSSIGYVAFLAGPPLLGLLADRVGFRLALLVIAGPLVVGAFLAGAAAPLPADRAPRPHDLVVEGAR
jgi:MFS family permease